MTDIERIAAFFERMSPADLDRLDAVYGPDARFKDPFNEVQGIPAIERVYAHMYATLDEPRFVIRQAVQQADQCFLTWDFHFRMRRFLRGTQTVRGASHLRLDALGRIADHRDYWDAAEEFYAKLPLVGRLMQWLRRQGTAR